MRTEGFQFSLRVPALIASFLLAVAAEAGFISLDTYDRNQDRGGVDMKAHYELGDDWDTDCCEPNKIRWIQLVNLTDDTGKPKKVSLPGFPYTSFIDPQPTQGGQNFDSLPWYDFTYAADWSNLPLDGKGAFIRDSPGGMAGQFKMHFEFVTLAVCTDPTAKTMQMLGGFNWGFDVSATGNITKFDAAAVVMDSRRSEFNAALYQTFAFADWDMVEADMDCKLTFNVPGPASISCITFGMAVVTRRRRVA